MTEAFHFICSIRLRKIIYDFSCVNSADASLISELKKLRLSIGDFNLKGVVGRGHFGEVQVVSEKQTGDVYAMKMLRKMDTLSQQNVR